jgi:hypothetical protein
MQRDTHNTSLPGCLSRINSHAVKQKLRHRSRHYTFDAEMSSFNSINIYTLMDIICEVRCIIFKCLLTNSNAYLKFHTNLYYIVLSSAIMLSNYVCSLLTKLQCSLAVNFYLFFIDIV